LVVAPVLAFGGMDGIKTACYMVMYGAAVLVPVYRGERQQKAGELTGH
jgi:hypothetical protein